MRLCAKKGPFGKVLASKNGKVQASWREELNSALMGLSKKEICRKVSSDPGVSKLASHFLKMDFFAGNTVISYNSEVKLYVQICEWAKIQPWPFDVVQMETFGKALKTAGYAKPNSYMSAVMTTNKMLGNMPAPGLSHFYGKVRKSLEADMGDIAKASPFTLKMLSEVRGKITFELRSSFLLACVSLFWMLRAEEVLEAKGCCYKVGCDCGRHVHFDKEAKVVVLKVAGDKTNWKERNIVRPLACSCDGKTQGLPMCPYHSMLELRKMS